MKKINLHEAEAIFSKLVDLAVQGEEVVICKAGIPVARLVAYKPTKQKRKSGSWAGKEYWREMGGVGLSLDLPVHPSDVKVCDGQADKPNFSAFLKRTTRICINYSLYIIYTTGLSAYCQKFSEA